MTWLANNYGNIIVIILILALLYICGKSVFFTNKSGCSSCGSGKSCSGCSLCSNAANLKNIVKGNQ